MSVGHGRTPAAPGHAPLLRDEDGVVLLLTLLLLLACALLSALLLLTARQEVRIEAARRERLRARAAAHAAAVEVAEAWPADAAALPLGASVLALQAQDGDVVRSGFVERIAPGAFLVRGRAITTSAPPAVAGTGLLLRTVDPLDIWRDFTAALVAPNAGWIRGSARVTGLAQDARAESDAACAEDGERIVESLFGARDRPGIRTTDPGAWVVEPGASVAGAPPAEAAPDSVPGRIGPVDASSLEHAADLTVAGVLALAARSAGGACDRHRLDNWGAPEDPLHPCADYFPLIFAPGDLELSGGAGQGILVVLGTLVLSGDARFYGPVLVLGGLRTAGDTRIAGALRAGTAAPLRVSGTLRYDACALARALNGAAALRRPFLPAHRRWLPIF